MGFHVLDAGRAPDLQAGGRQMLRTLGAPLANHAGAPAVLATGAVGLALLLLRLRRSWGRLGWRTLDSPWLAIGAYGLCSAALVGLGRQIPSDEVIPSKYATSVSPFWIGLALMYLESERRLAFAWLLVPALATVTAVQARPTYQAATRTIQSARSALFAPVDNPLLGRLYPDPTRPERDVATLRELGLSIYRCACPLSRADWTAAAGILAMRARPDDLLIATNDWNAGCLSDQLVRLERALRLVSVDESQEAARAQLDGVTDAFVLTGGDVHGNDAKDWLERRSVPLYRSPNGAMRLLYYPDRAHYVRTRLTPSEIQADHDRFRSLDDLIAPVASPFLLGGWTSGGVSEFGGTRRMFDRQASIYVPVVDDAPRTLRVGVTLVDARVVGGRLEIWVNEARLASMHLAAEPVVQEVSLAGAGWEYGGNVVSLRAPALDRPADDTSPLLAFDRLKLSY
jgi:hypothetical protein